MLFSRLAGWVVRNHKAIVAGWVIILLVSAPLMMKIGDVVVYQEVGMGPEDTESARASRIIDEQYPTAVANASAILVLQSDDLDGVNVRDFCLALEERIVNDSELEDVDSFTSIYSVYRDALNGLVNSTAANLHATEDGVNQTASLLYGMPANFIYIHNYTNGTVTLMYGVPKFHKMMWDQSTATNATQRDLEAYNAGLFMLQSFGAQGFPLSQMRIVYQYYNLSCEKWNDTRFDPKYGTNSMLRAQKSVNDSLPEFIELLGVKGVPEAEEMLRGIRENWTVQTYYLDMPPLFSEGNNLPRLNLFANRSIYSMMLAGLKDGDVAPSDAVRFLQYHNLTMSYWGQNTSKYNSASNITWAKSNLIMNGIISYNAPQFLSSTFASDPQGYGFSIGVLGNFSMDSWNDSVKIHTYSLALMKYGLESSGISFGNNQLEEIWAMGESPSQTFIDKFVDNLIKSGTYMSYPLKLPQYALENFVGRDNRTMLIVIAFTQGGDDKVERLRWLVSDVKSKRSFSGSTYLTGDMPLNADLANAAYSDVEKIDPVTVALIILFIAFFFASVVTPFIPLMVMGMGIVVSQALLFIIGSTVAKIHYSVTIILFVLLLGAGCDYCIFIIARYREERRRGRDVRKAVQTSLTWAGESIATSGITVIIGFSALAVGSFSLMRTMGLVMALALGIALAIALTLLPSLLILVGDRVFWPSKIKKADPKTKTTDGMAQSRGKKKGDTVSAPKRGLFGRAARYSIRNAKAIVLLAVIIAVPTTWAAVNFQSSFDFIGTMPKTESTDGLDAMGEGFGQGNIAKTYIIVQFDRTIYNGNGFNTAALDAIDNLTIAIRATGGVEKADVSTVSDGVRVDRAGLDQKDSNEKNSSVYAAVGKDQRTVLITVVLKSEPFARDAMTAISDIRTVIGTQKSRYTSLSSATILVGGSTADLKDVQKVTDSDFQNMVIIVVIGIFIVLLVVLGSVLIPIRLIITIALSISWTLALSMVIFEFFMDMPLLWLMPMILFVVMMGLGMDYDIFLCTRMREEVSKGKSDVQAIVTAVEKTGGIITICGAIMAGAIGTMMLSSMGLLQQFGFALFFAIIVDATIVRIVLVPAIMVLLQKWNWWAPGPLQRVKRDKNGKVIVKGKVKKFTPKQ